MDIGIQTNSRKNERKTEDIVRDHFRKYDQDIILESQASDNPKIHKLLATASKKGLGVGRPEFIIQFKNEPDLIVIVECKASTSKHESKERNQPSEYAVDGALLYSSYLSKEFDVISIAVSGQNLRELRVSHFLQLREEKQATEKFSDKLLDPESYLRAYLKSPEKFRQDYDKLLLFSKSLNDKLHGHKIVESDRGLLISCILIALENSAFLKSYKEYARAEDLARYLVDTVEMEFKNSGIQEQKLAIVKSRFEFIKTDTSLSTLPGVLREIISDIDENINAFIKTHKYFDVLGQLYIEFLRYANSDKGLGIVLTPPHVTEFMAELAEVNKNSIVYDSCAGTGGFLVSAMKVMIEDAKEDQEKIENIKKKQLIGVEYQAHIFALACSNMFIHQDGKTSILKGSCFDVEIMNEVKEQKPTVGLLNPPYKAEKNDTEELEFILSNLDCLEQGGKCVAIVPLSAALSQKGKIFELKQRLLQNHTLEAVLSMPDELFFNSNVAVVSCIMIITAKRPHPMGKKTFFGYFKNDGFKKRKNKGRIDVDGSWGEIKKNWINAYMNKEDIPGLSVSKEVKANDEWCAEAYMETDLNPLSEETFASNLLLFVAYELSNKLIKNVSYSSEINVRMDLNTINWKYFDLIQLFEISASKDELMDILTIGGKTPYVTSSDSNNGVTSYVEEEPTNKAKTITANRGGSVGYFYYQPVDFKATPVDVRILTPKFEINTYIGIFMKTVLQLEKYRFNYSRKMGSDRLSKFRIRLPADGDRPDWGFMEKYIKSLPYSSSLS